MQEFGRVGELTLDAEQDVEGGGSRGGDGTRGFWQATQVVSMQDGWVLVLSAENAGFARGTDECVRPYMNLFLAEFLAGTHAIALDEVACVGALLAF